MGSSNATRTTQHKATRETKAKEIAALKQENKALRKQLTRMRRQLQKIMETHQIAVDSSQEEPVEALVKEGAASGCEKCSSQNVAQIQLPTGTLIACKDCGHRRKAEK